MTLQYLDSEFQDQNANSVLLIKHLMFKDLLQ